MENTRELIIEKSFLLFLHRSYEAVSISEISKEIGFTKGALYHHFKNKEELFKCVVDKYLVITEVVADINKVSLFEYIQLSYQQAEKVLKDIFSFGLVYAPINYMSMFMDAFRHYPGYAESKEVFINNEIEKAKIVLDNAVRSGEIREDVNTSLVAMNLFSINLGLAGNLVRNNSLEEAIQLLKEQTTEFYKLLKKS